MKHPVLILMSMGMMLLSVASAHGQSQYSTDYTHLYEPSNQSQTILVEFPSRNPFPNSAKDCEDISDKAQKEADRINTLHQACIDQGDKDHDQRQKVEDTNTQCTYAQCQYLHVANKKAASYQDNARLYAEECRQAWDDKEAAARKKKEEDEKRKRDQEAAEQKQKDDAAKKKEEQVDAQRDAQKKAEDDAEARKRAQEEAEEKARKQAERDQQMQQWALEQRQRDQDALAARTAERQQALKDVDANYSGAISDASGNVTMASNQIASQDSRMIAQQDALGGNTDVAAKDDYADPDTVPDKPKSLMGTLGDKLASFFSDLVVDKVRAGMPDFVETVFGKNARKNYEDAASLHDQYTELKGKYDDVQEDISIWTRLTGSDRRDSLDATADAGVKFSGKVFNNPVQKFMVKKNVPTITNAANNSFDQVDRAYQQFDGGTADDPSDQQTGDFSNILGLGGLKKWDADTKAQVDTYYENAQNLFTVRAN